MALYLVVICRILVSHGIHQMKGHLCIVDKEDRLLLEQTFPFTYQPDRDTYVNHLALIYASLDKVDELLQSSSVLYLRVIEKHKEWHVSAYVTPSSLRIVLLHDTVNEEAIRSFFTDVHETLIKVRA